MATRYLLGAVAGATGGGLLGAVAGNLPAWVVAGMVAGAGFIGIWQFLETRRNL